MKHGLEKNKRDFSSRFGPALKSGKTARGWWGIVAPGPSVQKPWPRLKRHRIRRREGRAERKGTTAGHERPITKDHAARVGQEEKILYSSAWGSSVQRRG